MKLVAKKKLRYPRGPQGKEYQFGESFVVLSERDRKALLLVGAAQEEPVTLRRAADPQPVTTRAMVAEAQGTARREGSAHAEADVRRPYKRRDMKAED